MEQKNIVLNCKFITPAFIYGASGEPEIRASTIKGLMRFWWRASYSKSNDIMKMRNEENEIFGGKVIRDNKEISYKAKVQIVAKLNKEDPSIFFNSNLIKKQNNNLDGYKYLFYTINLGENRQKKHFNKDVKFSVKFSFLEKNSNYVVQYLKAFNILQLFGGIGARSRRGGGNFCVTSVNNDSRINSNEIKRSIYVKQWMNEKPLLDYYKELLSNTGLNCSDVNYSNIFSDKCKIILCSFTRAENKRNKTYEFEKNLNTIGTIYKDLRSKVKRANKRGDSPLIIKVVNDNDECKILIIKLAGGFCDRENEIVDSLFNKLKRDKKINKCIILKDEYGKND